MLRSLLLVTILAPIWVLHFLVVRYLLRKADWRPQDSLNLLWEEG